MEPAAAGSAHQVRHPAAPHDGQRAVRCPDRAEAARQAFGFQRCHAGWRRERRRGPGRAGNRRGTMAAHLTVHARRRLAAARTLARRAQDGQVQGAAGNGSLRQAHAASRARYGGPQRPVLRGARHRSRRQGAQNFSIAMRIPGEASVVVPSAMSRVSMAPSLQAGDGRAHAGRRARPGSAGPKAGKGGRQVLPRCPPAASKETAPRRSRPDRARQAHRRRSACRSSHRRGSGSTDR